MTGSRVRTGGQRGTMAYLIVVSCVAALYVATGWLGLQLANVQENATLIWAPTGLSLAALVLFGRRVWPGVLIGAAITNATIGTSPVALVAIAAGNTLEAVVGATLLEKLARFNAAFARLRDVLGFLVYGALTSTMISATIGVGSLYLTGAVDAHSFGSVWLIWWLGDAGGATVVAPLLLVGLEGRPPWTAMARRVETWVALLLLAALVSFTFGAPRAGPQSLLTALLVFPVLVWAGLRLGPRGAIVGSFLTGLAAVLGTARGLGPFAGSDPSSSLFVVWAYISTIGAVAMILAAAVAEREDADLSRRRGEEDRARLAAQLQHAQRLESLGLLAGGVAHDFNNLLTTIRGNADLLRLGARLDASQREAMLDEIDMASVEATNLCRQLLTYSGHNRPEKQRLNLTRIIEELVPLLRRSIPRDVDLQILTAEPRFIEGERAQIGQILMNLVINAAESIEGSAAWVRVSVSAREVGPRYLKETFLHSDAPAGRYVVLEVSDSGCGMTPEMMERIFDPFFTTKKLGRGLGMATVRGIVSAHGGAIKVQSAPGRGTTFEVLLPLVAEPECTSPDPTTAGSANSRPDQTATQ